MNVPAKRFSLTRILGNVPGPAAPGPIEAAPAPKEAVPTAPAPVLAAVPFPVEPHPIQEVAPAVTAAVPAPAITGPGPERKGRAAKPAPIPSDGRHPKKKRSYSVDMGVCEDLELLAWYQRKSSSSVVEELVRRYLSGHREEIEKARTVQVSR